MARIVAFSDLHMHAFRAYSLTDERGRNCRLNDTVSCIRQIADGAVTSKADVILFGGDWHHERKQLGVSTLCASFEAFTILRDTCIPVIAIPGNHDQADRAGHDHGLAPFGGDGIHLVTEPGWTRPVGGVSVLAIPHTEDFEAFRAATALPCPYENARYKVLLAHAGIQGARVGSGLVLANPYDLAVADLAEKSFDLVLLGHYHMHQQLGERSYYIGSPLQHEWGDSGQRRGYLVIDMDGERPVIEHVECKAPRFVKAALEDAERIKSGAWQDCVVRLSARGDVAPDTLERIQRATGARFVELDLDVVADAETAAELPQVAELDSLSLVDEYVEELAGGDDAAWLREAGRGYMARAQEGAR